MLDNSEQLEIQEGKIIDFIDGKARPDNELEQIRQNVERTLIEEYQFDKADIGVDIPIKVPDGSKTVRRKLAIAVFRNGGKEREQADILILIQTAKPGVQPTDTKGGADDWEKALIACPTRSSLAGPTVSKPFTSRKRKGSLTPTSCLLTTSLEKARMPPPSSRLTVPDYAWLPGTIC